MALTIESRGLTKRFDQFVAVDNVSFEVEKGSIFGFLGPNGSGKSTCIRMLCGVLEPSGGSATVNGFDVARQSEDVKRSIGYMSQSFSLYRDLTCRENLRFFGGIYGLSGSKLTDRMDAVCALVGLEKYMDQTSGTLSGGWKQRLALAAALIHEPPVIFLDEPTAGIDPVARRALWDLLFDLAGNGKTLFVTTHYMDEAERCSQVAYIYHSKLMVNGTPRELKALSSVSPEGTRRISVSVDKPAVGLRLLKNLPYVLDATLVEAEVHLLIQENTAEKDILKVLREAGMTESKIRTVEPSLEDVFVSLTRGYDRQ